MNIHERNIERGVLRCCRRVIAAREGTAPEQLDLTSVYDREEYENLVDDLKACCEAHPLWLEVLSEPR